MSYRVKLPPIRAEGENAIDGSPIPVKVVIPVIPVIYESELPALSALTPSGRLADLEAEEAPEPSSASSAEEVAALPLDAFGSRSLMFKVWSRLLDEEIWFVSGEVQVRILQGRDVSREEIYTAQELADLLNVFEKDPDKAWLVVEAKKLFGGSMRLEKAP